MGISSESLRMRDLFFQPVADALVQAKHHRACPALSDYDFIASCCLRVHGLARSGRGHLQNMFNHDIMEGSRQNTEANVSSVRRLQMMREVNDSLLSLLHHQRENLLKHIPELKKFDVYAADGHFHGAASRDEQIDGVKRPPEHFYALNLKSYGLSHLTLAQIGGAAGKKREHDMHALKRLVPSVLRMGAPFGKKVIYVYDRAGIDFMQWTKWKMNHGIYFISREKKNMALETIGISKWDANDPVNAGVLSDDIVGSGYTAAIRRVTYVCPENGETLVFLTNCFDLRPGVIAYLYKRRWDIEKVFDEVKNKLDERKAWSKKDVAKEVQAMSIAIHHNLTRLFEQYIDMVDVEKDDRARSAKRLETIELHMRENGEKLTSLRLTMTVITQHSLKFIRWLRVGLECNRLLDQARVRLSLLLRATY